MKDQLEIQNDPENDPENDSKNNSKNELQNNPQKENNSTKEDSQGITARKKRLLLRKWKERPVEILFFLCATISILAVVLITLFLFNEGMPSILQIGIFKFIFGTQWSPGQGEFGIATMIVSSLAATFLSVGLGTVIGVFTAVFLAEIAPGWLARIARPAISLLSAIPSVIYGFFGMLIIVPLIRNIFSTPEKGVPGYSLLAVVIVLTVMILPTIIMLTENALRALPSAYKEASLALGATKIQTIFKVLIPAARSGIMAAIVLGMGRAIGETMAVIMVAGNSTQMPSSLLTMIRTMTGNVALELSYSSGLHRQALFGTGVVLFVFIMLLNLLLTILSRQAVNKK